jgi:acyl-CoA thioester hydrolase
VDEFSKVFHARWGDMDFNGHMRNTAFLDACGDIRMMFFAEHGFAMADFARLGIGPVIRRDELDYFRELRLLDPVRVTLVAAGQSDDGSQFRILNEFWRDDGRKAARVVSTGGWLDLQRRRFVAPPDALLTAMRQMPAAEAIEALPSLVRPG